MTTREAVLEAARRRWPTYHGAALTAWPWSVERSIYVVVDNRTVVEVAAPTLDALLAKIQGECW